MDLSVYGSFVASLFTISQLPKFYEVTNITGRTTHTCTYTHTSVRGFRPLSYNVAKVAL